MLRRQLEINNNYQSYPYCLKEVRRFLRSIGAICNTNDIDTTSLK